MTAPASPATIETPAGPRAFHHRGSRADLGVIRQSFPGQRIEEIAPGVFGRRLQRHAARLAARGRRPLILDLGANIGATAVRLACLYPQARIVAVEPHPGNVALLARNVAGLDVEIRAAAIGPAEGVTRIANPEAEEWAYRTGTAGTGPAVPVLTIPGLLRDAAARGLVPFILKCDIEGAEAGLFDADSAWFDDFAMVLMEPHDWMLTDRMTANGFLRAHLRTPRQLLLRGENLLSLRPPPARRGGSPA